MSFINLLIANKSMTPVCCVLYFTLPGSELFASTVWDSALVQPDEEYGSSWSDESQVVLATDQDALMSPFTWFNLQSTNSITLISSGEDQFAIEPTLKPNPPPPGHAVVANGTGKALNIGLGAGGQGKAYALDVLSGTNVLLDLSPRAWLAVYQLPPAMPPPTGKLIHLDQHELWHDPKAINAAAFANSAELVAYNFYRGFLATLLPGPTAPRVEIVNIPL